MVDQFLEGDYSEEWDLASLVQAMNTLYGSDVTEEELRDEVGLDRDALVDEFVEDALDEYRQREARFGADDTGTPIMRELERFIILQIVDTRWREHLENMDYMREGIHLRGMAQKDPLVEYRNEGHTMFQDLNLAIREEVVALLFHAEVTPDDGSAEQLQQAPSPNGTGTNGLSYEHQSLAGADAIAAAGGAASAGGVTGVSGGSATPIKPKVNSELENIGRNDPCWCGSGKKYKKCHGV
jgi:preprotein translocase subunit SecA